MRWRCRPGYPADPGPPRTSRACGAGGALFRPVVPNQHSRVTYAELFFDLVFVFAVTQISHTLRSNVAERRFR